MKKLLLIFSLILVQAAGENMAKMGEDFMKLRNWPMALSYYQAALKENPSLAPAWYGKGLSLCQLKKFDEGISALNRAIELEPKNADYLYVTGVCYEWKGKDGWEQAEAYYQKTLELIPNEPQLHHKLATLYQQEENYPEAIAEFKKTIEINPDYYISYNNLAGCYLALHQPEEAVKLYREAILHAEDPGRYHFYFHLGLALLVSNQIKGAKAAFLIESALNPDFVDARLDLGNIYLLENNFERAIEEYQQVLVIQPDQPEAHYNLGQIFLSLNQSQLAFKHFQRYVELKPDSGPGHYYLGICYARLDEQGKAWEEYNKSIQLGYRPEILRRKINK